MLSHSFSVMFDTPKQARAAITSLQPELGLAHERGAYTRVTRQKNRVIFHITAENPRARKASTYQYGVLAHYIKRIAQGDGTYDQ